MTIPQEALPSPNAFDYDVKAGAVLKDRDKINDALSLPGSPFSGAGAGTYTLAQKEQLVLENAETLRLLRAGFAYRYECPQSRTEFAAFRHFSQLRTIASLLKLEGQVDEAHGDWGALDDYFLEYGVIDSDSSRLLHNVLALGLKDSTKRSVFDTYTRYRNEFIASARAPYAAHVPVKRVPLAPNNIVASFAFHYDPYQSCQILDTLSQTQDTLLLTDLAVRAYALDHDKPPNTLTDLVPEYLTKIPQDPFGMSGSLRYRITGDKYVLYSAGPDDRDDHGTAIYDATKSAPTAAEPRDARYDIVETSKGDIVAGVNTQHGLIGAPRQ